MTLYEREILAALISYLIGGFSTGYLLVRFIKGDDVRNQGSKAIGATNVGRVLGSKGFVITLLGDLLKGIIVTELALYLNLKPWGVILAILAVVLGHIFPLQLGFRGGKGIATALGALTVLDFKLVLATLLIFFVTFAISRLYTISGLFAVTASPVVALMMGRSPTHVSGLVILVLLILVSHRHNIQEIVRNIKR